MLRWYAARGMSLVALHNGGGTGIGKAINGGFGLVLTAANASMKSSNPAIAWDTIEEVFAVTGLAMSMLLRQLSNTNCLHKELTTSPFRT